MNASPEGGAGGGSGPAPGAGKAPTVVTRTSDRETVVTRTFNAPARLVFEAWTTPALLKRWWTPRSMNLTLVGCEIDLRTGGGYRFEIVMGDAPPMVFLGRYLEVTPFSRLVWTNEEGADGPVTTITFEEHDGRTLLTHHELYPSKAALDEAIAQMPDDSLGEQFGQLDEVLASGGPGGG